MIKTILFTDIHNSSRLWKLKPEEMFRTLEIHDNLVKKHAKINKGFIVKKLGDSFMISFNHIMDAINFAINLQEDFPIEISGKYKMELKIGIARGKVIEKNYILQGCELIDYFGHTVNVSARLESLVAKKNQIVVVNLIDNISDLKIQKLFKNKGYKSKKILYQKNIKECRTEKDVNIECRLLSELRGIGKLDVNVFY